MYAIHFKLTFETVRTLQHQHKFKTVKDYYQGLVYDLTNWAAWEHKTDLCVRADACVLIIFARFVSFLLQALSSFQKHFPAYVYVPCLISFVIFTEVFAKGKFTTASTIVYSALMLFI